MPRGLTTQMYGSRHQRLFGGAIWYVDGTRGNDAYGGTSPNSPFATITAGLAHAVAGDAINVRAGTYDEAGLDLALDAMELWCEIGVIIIDTTPGVPLTVSGDYCKVVGVEIAQAGAAGIVVTGARCELEDCSARLGTVALDIDGTSCGLTNCRAGQYTTTGFDLGANGPRLRDCLATGTGGATRGFYASAAENVKAYNCKSSGNATAGFEITAVSTGGMWKDCSSAPSDGRRVDAAIDTFWPGFDDTMRRQRHEHEYPPPAGEGVASTPVNVSNNVTDDSGAGPWDDQDYWGDVVTIVPMDTIEEPWLCLGLYIHAETALDIQQWELFFTNDNYSASRNAGNAWDYQETVLTVDDATNIAVGDKVWITGTGHVDGEIVNVADVTGNDVTITSEARVSADTGLKYDYAGAEQMFVVYRPTDRVLHGYDGDYSAASAKDFSRFSFSQAKMIEANGAAIMRMANGTDAAASSVSVRIIYMD